MQTHLARQEEAAQGPVPAKEKPAAPRRIASAVPVAPAAPPQEAPEPDSPKTAVTACGVIEPLGERAISTHIRHRIVVDAQHIYFLLGYRNLLDGFSQQKVKIEGEPQTAIKAQYPVLLVTKIHLVL